MMKLNIHPQFEENQQLRNKHSLTEERKNLPLKIKYPTQNLGFFRADTMKWQDIRLFLTKTRNTELYTVTDPEMMAVNR